MGIKPVEYRSCVAAVLLGLLIASLLNQGLAAATENASDPVSVLQARIDDGQTRLSFDSRHGWLESVLRELKVPVDSQGLVFSKTSFQASRISPQNPRALYFNDDVYVGWVRGGDVVEVASVDPKQGPVFYMLPQRPSPRPKFVRQTAACLQCHQSQLTGDLPGLLMRSVYPDASGMPVLSAGTYVTTEQSPLKERWGGWYMDGTVGDQQSMGDGMVEDADHPEQLKRTESDLSKQFDASDYLSPHSDVVALAVLAHQTHLHNLLTRAAAETRAALADDAALRQVLHTSGQSETTRRRIRAACEPVVQCMLFCREASLGRISGSTDFAADFQRLGPRDRQARSLRDLDLNRRLFRYPCSYLIYSAQFDDLPDSARQYIYRRLWQVLTGRDDSSAFDHLSDDDRDAIYDILQQTKKGLPAYWKPRS